jgi:hypothetical protein
MDRAESPAGDPCPLPDFRGTLLFNEATSEIENRLCESYDVSDDGMETPFICSRA